MSTPSSSTATTTSSSSSHHLRTIPLDELKKHGDRNDAWIGLRGKVYDVTSYVSQHPGGFGAIKQGFGIDATKLFNQAHSYVNFERILAGKQVGVLPGKK